MNCPNCQEPEKARVKTCPCCGHAYASEDLLKLRQLEYLLDETNSWEGVTSYRVLYQEHLEQLKRRILPVPIPIPDREIILPQEPAEIPEKQIEVPKELETFLEPEPEPALIPEEKTAPVPPPLVKPAIERPVEKPSPPKEKVPFDQWLLSERNIKIALYTGAALLVLAGIIFIGVNWTRFSGGLKFAITSLVTALTYFGGYLLFKRPALRLGGNALFGIAGGFFALNFGVLQIYVLGPMGLPNDVMWLITSPICLILYMFTAYWTKSDLFTYFSIAAIGSTLAAALIVASAPTLAFIPAFSLLASCLWGLSIWLKKSTLAEYTVTPLIWVSQIMMPVTLIIAGLSWLFYTGCINCSEGSPFLSIAAVAVGGLFYIFTDVYTTRKEPRWAVPVIFTAALAFTMIELDFSDTNMGVGMMLLALVYLWVGYWLDRKSSQTIRNISFYIMAFLVAIYLTYSTFIISDDRSSLIVVLFGDVLLLGCTSFIKRDRVWLYGAIWLMMVPIYLWADLLIPEMYYQGLVMFGLATAYLGIGYLVGRKSIQWGGPFLTASAFLSWITVGMTLDNLVIASIVLAAWAVFYPLTAAWLKWTWLILPGLVMANIAIATLNIEFVPEASRWDVLVISYVGWGILSWLAGKGLSRLKPSDWSWPTYLIGAIDLGAGYLASLWFGGWLAIGISVSISALFLVFASLQKSKFLEKIIFPLLPYLGFGILFIAHFYLISEIGLTNLWPALTSGVCALFAGIAWLIREKKANLIYGNALRFEGLSLFIIPFVGSLLPIPSIETWVAAIAFSIGGVVFFVDAGLRQYQLMAYLGVGISFIAQLFITEAAGVFEYWTVITAGGCTLFAAIAWLMRKRKLEKVYELPLRLGGLGLMMLPLIGTAAYYTSWMAALTFILCAAVYLADAGIRQFQPIAFPGVGVLFIAQFFILDYVWSGAWGHWPVVAVSVCTLFAAIAWQLRGRKLANVYELPFRLGGLGLMIVPIALSVVFYIPWVAALVFGVCGLVYLIDAGMRDLQLMAFPGMAILFVTHFFILDAVWKDAWDIWPVFTAAVCAVYTAAAWLLMNHKKSKVYELPFRMGGLGLIVLALAGSMVVSVSWVSAIVFSVCGILYLVDAGLRRLQLMAFAGVAVIYIAHVFIRQAIWPAADNYWQPIAAGVSALFAVASWLVRKRKLAHVYLLPFSLGGFGLMLIPLVLSLSNALIFREFILCAITFGIGGAIYLGEAVNQDIPPLGYLGVLYYWIVLWAVLSHYDVSELQAYVLPFGLALLGVGWYERTRYEGRFYRLTTMIGCMILLGTAFYQSLPRDAWVYALLVGIESIIAILWGIRTKSRGYVQVGGLALIGNALVQFVPSFLEWSRWMQIGLTGTLLLGLGLLALFRREKLLETRQKIATEWRNWKP